MSSVIRRTLYKSLVRQAKELDKTNIAGFILSSSALTSQMSSELQAVVQTDNVIALDLVRVMARKGCHVSVGFEASRWMGLINRSVSEPLVTFKRGDIIRHKLIDDIGVVLNVYPSCNMPKGWISRAFGSTDHPLINQPWYDVVLDKRNGGFTTHTTGLFNESVTCEIESPLLKAEGWKYDNSAGCYQPPQAIKR